MEVTALFLDGHRTEEAVSIETLHSTLRKGQEKLRAIPVDSLLSWLEEASSPWLNRNHPLHQRHHLGYLLPWMRSAHLRQMADTSLRGNRHALDGFASLPGLEGHYACFPRGVACHWLAGNVPILGMLSLLQGLLTKNSNIIKTASAERELLPDLLESLAEQGGGELLSSVAVVTLSKKEAEAHRALSLLADVRIAWGGSDAIEAITALPKQPHCEDLLFGPRTSLAFVGKECSDEKSAKLIAIDASLLEQRGCNSPHTVFVEKGGSLSPLDFAGAVAAEMAALAQHYPPNPIPPGKVGSILALRAEHEMLGSAWHSPGMGWSVLYRNEPPRLTPPLFYRTLFVRPLERVSELYPLCSHQTQSVGLAMEEMRRRAVAYELMARGVDRCPPLGQMTHYDSPWDGCFPMDRLVRWVQA